MFEFIWAALGDGHFWLGVIVGVGGGILMGHRYAMEHGHEPPTPMS